VAASEEESTLAQVGLVLGLGGVLSGCKLGVLAFVSASRGTQDIHTYLRGLQPPTNHRPPTRGFQNLSTPNTTPPTPTPPTPQTPTPNPKPHSTNPKPQVTVQAHAPLIGHTIRDTGFRGRFDAAVIAVKRHNVKQGGRLGDVVVEKGDVLVLSVGPKFDASSDDFKHNFKKWVVLFLPGACSCGCSCG